MLSLLALLAGGLTTVAPAHAAIENGLLLHYRLDQTSGTTVTDASGHGRHGTVSGDTTWLGSEGLALGGRNGHVQLPDNLMSDLSAITVSAEVKIATDQATPYFIWGLGNTGTDGTGNGYLFTTGNAYRAAIATGNWSTEQEVKADHNVARGVWKTLTYTLAGGTARLYEDGTEVASKTGVTITPGQVGGGTTKANYLGRSVYSGDRYLKGEVRDFRVYDRALGATEVRELGFVTDEQRVSRDVQVLDLGDTSRVTTDLDLPQSGPNLSTYTWSSSNQTVVSSTGVVTRPAHGAGDATVTLTATATHGTATASKDFVVVVPEDISDSAKVTQDMAALRVWDAGAVRGNLTLPTEGPHGTAVRWHSSDPSVVTATGEVTRPAYGQKAVGVVLMATVNIGKTKDKRQFRLTVLPMPKTEPRKGYMFAYFTGEGTADGEQVYFAASKGNDALHWDELNGGQPVLRSEYGDKGVRDPFIIRSPEGDKFYLIATDLKINGNGNWDAAQRQGSRYIEVWESTDLVNWSEQRHVRVSPAEAGNTWAPEAFYDEALGSYVVFWASKLYDAGDTSHAGNTYNRMMYATTRDFRTFSEPKVWIDPGYSVIDSTVVRHGDTYYRFTKDERNNTSSTPCSKFIVEQKATSLLDLSWDDVAQCIGKETTETPGISQGEGPTIFKSNTENKWYLFIDEFGGRGYVPFETTDLESGKFRISADYQLPSRPRHGTVLPVTKAELDRLRATYRVF
jgi:hypothetical protein